MKTKRNKPHIGATVDPDVAKWLREEAKRRRLGLSGLINQVLASAMERDKTKVA